MRDADLPPLARPGRAATPRGSHRPAGRLARMERAVIVEGARTPIGKFLGSFAETPAVELGDASRRSRPCGARTSSADQVDQTIMGHARQAGNGPNTGRQVSIRAGVPEEVSAFNVNIACGSGMKATQLGAQQIMLGEADVVLVGGMENMTRVPFLLPNMRLGYRLGNTEAVDAMYRDGLLDPLCGLIMGETAENLVDRYGISPRRTGRVRPGVPAQGRRGRRGQGSRDRARRGHEGPRDRQRHRRRARAARHHHGDPRQAGTGVPRGRQRHRGQLQRHHRRRSRHGADERVPRQGRRARAHRRDHRDVVGRRSPGDHGHRAGARHEEGHGPLGLHDRRLRGDRDQRGLRRAGDRLRTRAEVRSRPAQHQGRRHLARATRSA